MSRYKVAVGSFHWVRTGWSGFNVAGAGEQRVLSAAVEVSEISYGAVAERGTHSRRLRLRRCGSPKAQYVLALQSRERLGATSAPLTVATT